MPVVGAAPSITPTREKLRRSDREWMEIVGGGRKPFRFCFRVFFQEFFFNFFFPYSVIFVKCFVPVSEHFLWNRQLVFFGFYKSVQSEGWLAGPALVADTFPRRALLFASDLGRMLWATGLRGLLWPLFIMVCYQEFVLDSGRSSSSSSAADGGLPLEYDFFAEVVLLWILSQIQATFISIKWAFFPDSFCDALKQERVPQFLLLNQQIMTQWSPTLAQTLCSEARPPHITQC
jgi:hypothetical protein